MNNTCSVIIPCYNVEICIDECIHSVINQTYRVKEIICVDNGSTDSTLSKLKAWEARIEEIRVLSEPKKGACAARNLGLKYATSEWLQFLDADDELHPDKILFQLGLVKESMNSIGFIAGASHKYQLNNKISTSVPNSDVWKGLFTTNFGNTCANLWSRKAIDSVGGWDIDLSSSQETDLMFRILKNREFGVLIDRKPLTKINTTRVNRISSINLIGNLERYAVLRLKIYKYLELYESAYLVENKIFFLNNLLILYGRLSDVRTSLAIFEIDGVLRKEISLLNPTSRIKLRLFRFKHNLVNSINKSR